MFKKRGWRPIFTMSRILVLLAALSTIGCAWKNISKFDPIKFDLSKSSIVLARLYTGKAYYTTDIAAYGTWAIGKVISTEPYKDETVGLIQKKQYFESGYVVYCLLANTT